MKEWKRVEGSALRGNRTNLLIIQIKSQTRQSMCRINPMNLLNHPKGVCLNKKQVPAERLNGYSWCALSFFLFVSFMRSMMFYLLVLRQTQDCFVHQNNFIRLASPKDWRLDWRAFTSNKTLNLFVLTRQSPSIHTSTFSSAKPIFIIFFYCIRCLGSHKKIGGSSMSETPLETRVRNMVIISLGILSI